MVAKSEDYWTVHAYIVGRVERSETRQMPNAHLALIWTNHLKYCFMSGFVPLTDLRKNGIKIIKIDIRRS